eukprot:COSAG04_NODE_591_length_12289_cov_10.947252_7_plen_233_part_00
MLDELITSGIMLADYNTFKICSPTRASILTGRYPWGAGFYDMNEDENHCTSNFTALPEMLKPLGYKTHALGSAPPSSTVHSPLCPCAHESCCCASEWDVGFMKRECTPTYRGYDTFYGYYIACEADYWYHGGLGCPSKSPDNRPGGLVAESTYVKMPTDLSNSSGTNIGGAVGVNGTYNRVLFSNEASRLVRAHDPADPFFMCTPPSRPLHLFFFPVGNAEPILWCAQIWRS